MRILPVCPARELDPEVRYGVENGVVIVQLHAVPDCPNLPATRELLRACLTELGLPVTVTELIGDYPSPSVLVDGVDVTGAATDAPAACVLAPPSADQIRTALLRVMPVSRGGPGDVAASDSTRECCPLPGDAIRADRPVRAAALPPGLRAVHRAVLRHFAATGIATTPADLVPAAASARLDPVTALRLLADQDLVAVDGSGVLVAAYPFSPTPTAHMVDLGDVRVWAMCAIDALGIPSMLGLDATITSIDPYSGEPITVTVTDGVATFAPAATVVVYAATGATGRSVDTCCTTINFFTTAAHAHAWTAARPELAATVLEQTAALALGRDIFGSLLD
jgi:hypothetical protein